MLFTAIVFILVLSVLVFVHELGHFFTARKMGVKAQEFGFGFPPRMFGWKKNGGKRQFFWGDGEVASEDTIYSMNWIPLGGFVKIKGEEGDNRDPDSFAVKKIWQRFVILAAGVSMNVALAIVCLIFVFMLGAPQAIQTIAPGATVRDQRIQIVQILENSSAQEAGLQVGDAIVAIDNIKLASITAVQDYVLSKDGVEVLVTIDRLGEIKEFRLIPRQIQETQKAGLGVALAETGIVSYPWYQAIWLGFKGAFIMLWQIIFAFYTIIKNAILGQPIGAEVAGPVGIAVMTGRVARLGLNYILQFTALLSLNLAIINFLPFPALDGGRVLFLIIEKIRGRAVNQKIEQVVHATGFAFLMILIVFVTGRDLWGLKDSFWAIIQKIIS